jgi:hypothetical protein
LSSFTSFFSEKTRRGSITANLARLNTPAGKEKDAGCPKSMRSRDYILASETPDQHDSPYGKGGNQGDLVSGSLERISPSPYFSKRGFSDA